MRNLRFCLGLANFLALVCVFVFGIVHDNKSWERLLYIQHSLTFDETSTKGGLIVSLSQGIAIPQIADNIQEHFFLNSHPSQDVNHVALTLVCNKSVGIFSSWLQFIPRKNIYGIDGNQCSRFRSSTYADSDIATSEYRFSSALIRDEQFKFKTFLHPIAAIRDVGQKFYTADSDSGPMICNECLKNNQNLKKSKKSDSSSEPSYRMRRFQIRDSTLQLSDLKAETITRVVLFAIAVVLICVAGLLCLNFAQLYLACLRELVGYLLMVAAFSPNPAWFWTWL